MPGIQKDITQLEWEIDLEKKVMRKGRAKLHFTELDEGGYTIVVGQPGIFDQKQELIVKDAYKALNKFAKKRAKSNS